MTQAKLLDCLIKELKEMTIPESCMQTLILITWVLGYSFVRRFSRTSTLIEFIKYLSQTEHYEVDHISKEQIELENGV